MSKCTSKSSLILVQQSGHVFETDDFGQRWGAGDEAQGLRVDRGVGPRVSLGLVEFSFVLPRFSAEDPGCYSIFTVARGDKPSDFWFPCEGSTSEGTGGVFLRVTYEPSRGLIRCGMNAGTPNRDLEWISLGPAPPEQYTGRVLRAFILITPDGLYPSIEDATSEQPELFGEFQLSTRLSGLPPWGVAPTGNWWVTSGCTIEQDRGEASFPPGFGLSDVRIHLLGPNDDDDFGMLPYSGELDHLLKGPEVSGDWDGEADVPLGEQLKAFADELAGLAGDAAKWAGHVLELAEETDELIRRLPEDLSDQDLEN